MSTISFEVVKGDITKIEVDAIVNAANTSLLGGGGVDGAIHRAGGPAILEACQKIRAKQGSCKVGEAVITPAGRLRARFVIHTVGPVWRGGAQGEPELLASAYRSSLRLAIDHEVKTIAFPGISTGIYGYPKQKAAEVAVTIAKEVVQTAYSGTLEKILFVCFDDESHSIYTELLASGR